MGPGAVFATLYFIRNLRIDPIKLECLLLAELSMSCNVILELIGIILKLRRK
jgi:hypothetical protein